MTPREQWQALQTTLTAARAAVARGDQAAALAAVNAALELDPNFLAAHSLRDRLVAGEIAIPVHTAAAEETSAAPTQDATTHEATPLPPADGYVKFEQRARRRRVDRRVEAARQAIERRHLRHAATALDEVIELDPNLPELAELTVQFDQLRRSTAVAHRGPWVAAAAVFAGSVLGASWLKESASPLVSRSTIASAPLIAAPTTSLRLTTDVESAAATIVEQAAVESAADRTPEPRRLVPRIGPPAVYAVATTAIARPFAEPAVEPPAVAVSAASSVTPAVVPAVAAAIAPPPEPQAPPIVAPPRPVQESAVAVPVTMPVPPRSSEVDENALVRQVLQRYRSAYEGLDARSAHVVWPAVNQVALARAFEGLESQTLTFNACDVRVRGEAATVTCQGSARYVPKIGNREPRTEPRVWNFTLHKAGAGWTIDSARAERN